MKKKYAFDLSFLFLFILLAFIGYFFIKELYYYIIILPLVIYYMIMAIILSGSTDTVSSFLFYDKKLLSHEFLNTFVATNIGFFSSIIFSAAMGYSYGYSAMIWGPLTWALGLVLIIFLLKTGKLLPHLKSNVTVHSFISNRFAGTSIEKILLRILTSTISIILLFSLIIVELKALLFVISPFMPQLSPSIIISAIAIITFLYVFITGYKGVVKTDFKQLLILILGTCSIVIAITLNSNIVGGNKFVFSINKVFDLGFLNILSLFVISIPYLICTMDMWQRLIATSESDAIDQTIIRNTVRSHIYSIIIFSMLFIIFIIMGMFTYNIDSTINDPNRIIPVFIEYINNSGVAGFIIVSIILITILSAVLSTIDTIMITVTQSYLFDLYPVIFKKGQFNDDINSLSSENNYKMVNISKYFIAILAIIVVLFQFIEIANYFNFLWSVYGLVVCMFPSIIIGILSTRKYSFYSSFISILAGFLISATIGYYGTFVLNNFDIVTIAPVIGLIVSFSLFGIIEIFMKWK